MTELHDSFTSGEILAYEALGFTPERTAEKFVADAANTYGGQIVTNPSGGMPAKGYPLGATGVAQSAEPVWRLCGQAGARQVDYANLALQHNVGFGGATSSRCTRIPGTTIDDSPDARCHRLRTRTSVRGAAAARWLDSTIDMSTAKPAATVV